MRMCKISVQAVAIVTLIFCIQTTTARDVISGKFDLVDHTGRPATEKSFNGKMRLVFFGYTQCPDVCPTTLLEVRRAMRLLGELAEEVQPLFISFDLQNDTSEILAAYVSAFQSSIVGLTGSAEQIASAAAAFNVTYGFQQKSESASGRNEVYHTSYLFLMDRQGQFVDVFGYGTKAEIIARAIQDYASNH